MKYIALFFLLAACPMFAQWQQLSNVERLNTGSTPIREVTTTARLTFSLRDESSVSLKLCNYLGHEMFSMENKIYERGEGTINLNLSSYPPGIYYFTLSAGMERVTKKFVVIR